MTFDEIREFIRKHNGDAIADACVIERDPHDPTRAIVTLESAPKFKILSSTVHFETDEP